MAKAALLPFQSAHCRVDAAQHFAVEAQMNLVVEMKRTGVPQSAPPPPTERRVVRVERGESGVERVPTVHRS
jgi:hypothetical protein